MSSKTLGQKPSSTKRGKSVFDEVTPARSNNMRAIASKNTRPERVVRSFLHKAGYRFRLHRKDLPGRPDIVFPARGAIVEVRGCFWHGHGCDLGKMPKSRLHYWTPKIRKTKLRDKKNIRQLRAGGWSVYEIWECEIRKFDLDFQKRLIEFLEAAKRKVI